MEREARWLATHREASRSLRCSGWPSIRRSWASSWCEPWQAWSG